MFTHSDPRARTAANLDFKKRCAEAKVLPYFVPVGGFMLTPRYDDDPELLGAAIKEMASCALATAREMGWSKSALLPLDGPPPSAPKPVERLRGPDLVTMDAPTTSFAPREIAVASLAVSYANRAPADWIQCVAAAREAGLEEKHIGALARGVVPPFKPHSKEAAIYAVSADLLLHKRVSANHYEDGVAALGEKGMVELVSLIGYYTYRTMTTNAFEVELEPEHHKEGVNPKAPWEHDRS